jgi:signal peptidase
MFGPPPRTDANAPARGAESDQVGSTLQALQSAASLLQAAMAERQGLLSELREAEQALSNVLIERLDAERALGEAQANLERTNRDIERVRAEHMTVLADFDQLVKGALEHRGSLIREISELERRRGELAQIVLHAAVGSVVAPPSAIQTVVSAPPSSPPSEVAPTIATSATVLGLLAPFTAPNVALSPAAARVEPAASTPLLHVVEPVAPAAVIPPAVAGAQAQPTLREAFSVLARSILTAAPRVASPRRLPGLRRSVTVVLAAVLLGLAVLLTPISQIVGGTQLLAVMSGSMEPTIPVGGLVAVRPVAANALQVGDVITFANQSNPDVLITHRIVSLESRGGQTFLSTKGDANDAVDAMATSPTRAVGRVDFALPWLGYVMVWFSSPFAKAAILVVSIVGFALPTGRKRPPEASPATPPADARAAVSPSYTALERELQTLLPTAG